MLVRSNFLPLAVVSLVSLTNTPFVNAECQSINQVPYCKAVSSIMYSNVGGQGSYQDVIGMDPKSCKCNTQPTQYSGPLEPLEELSLHFRGPLILKQIAAYYPSSSPQAQRCLKGHSKSIQKSGGDYIRTSWYNAEKKIAQGLVFLNHMGDDKVSGTWDTCWGNSLSYADSQCTKPARNPQVLADIPFKSNQEFVVFTDEKCDDRCGYCRPKTPAYRGFDGKNKMFAFEFGMPDEPSATGANPNIPAIWALNAKTPRTSQYSACSPWKSGGGEFDLFEVLKDATSYVKTHFHSNQGLGGNGMGGGGSPDYFKRPFNKIIKAVVIFSDDGTVGLKIVTSFDFSDSINIDSIKTGDKDSGYYNVTS